MITITQAAKNYILEELEEEKYEAIKISTIPGGCSGTTYKFSFANEAESEDEIVQIEGLKLFIAPSALLFIIGTELDYEITPTGAKLIFNNLKTKSRCSCGKSFSI